MHNNRGYNSSSTLFSPEINSLKEEMIRRLFDLRKNLPQNELDSFLEQVKLLDHSEDINSS